MLEDVDAVACFTGLDELLKLLLRSEVSNSDWLLVSVPAAIKGKKKNSYDSLEDYKNK